jgi:hypothetical protein
LLFLCEASCVLAAVVGETLLRAPLSVAHALLSDIFARARASYEQEAADWTAEEEAGRKGSKRPREQPSESPERTPPPFARRGKEAEVRGQQAAADGRDGVGDEGTREEQRQAWPPRPPPIDAAKRDKQPLPVFAAVSKGSEEKEGGGWAACTEDQVIDAETLRAFDRALNGMPRSAAREKWLREI